MIELVFIELFSVLTFFYTALLMILNVGSASEMMMILAASAVFGLIVTGLTKKFKWFALLSILSLLPILYFENVSSIIFFSVQAIILFLYATSRDVFEDLEVKFVVKSALSYLVVSSIIFWTVAKVFLLTSGESMKYMWPFFVLFLMSSVMYLRSVRHIDGKLDHKKIRKSNIRYIFMMMGVYSVILFSDFKDEVSDLEDFLKDVAYFFLKPVYKILEIFNLDMSGKEVKKMESALSDKTELGREEAAQGGIQAVKDYELSDDGNLNYYIYIFAALVVVIVMFFVIKKLLREKAIDKEEFEPEVEEVRTYIKNDKQSKLSKFFRNLGAKTPKEQIRASYRKHLNYVEREEEILKSDTTSDIQEKADDLGFEHTKEIRDVYGHIRYGDNEPTKEMLHDIKTKVK